MAINTDLLKSVVDANKFKSLYFLGTIQQYKANISKSTLKTTSTVTFLNNQKPKIKHPSFFADAKNITALRREHSRIKTNQPADKFVSVGLHILDNIVCLQNPSKLDVDYMHRLALTFFKQAARANSTFGLYLTGAANLYGYCNSKNITTGLQQIKEAAKRKCAEAQNFLGLYFARTNFIMYACLMFRDAALGGHPSAPINYKATQQALQKIRQITLQRSKQHARKMQHRRRVRARQSQYC